MGAMLKIILAGMAIIKKSAFALTIHGRLTCIAPISDRSRFSYDIFTTLRTSLDITIFSSKFANLLAKNTFNLDLKFLSLCDCTIAAMQITHFPLISDHFHSNQQTYM